MLRKLRSALLFGGLSASVACHSPPPTTPSIAKGDYSAIVRYLQTKIPLQLARYHTAGLSIALVHDQELIWARGFGYADKKLALEVTANTAFRAGSLSQLFSATAVLQLLEKRCLTLDQPIQELLPEFLLDSHFHPHASNRDITVRRLLSHQAGLPFEHLRGRYSVVPISQIPATLSGVQLTYKPGSQVAYSNMGYVLLGSVIERCTNHNFEAQLQRSLLVPLESDHSSFTGGTRGYAFRAQGYHLGTQLDNNEQVRDLPADGLWTTPRDLSHYVQMLFAKGNYKGQRILSEATLKVMFTPQNTRTGTNSNCQIGIPWQLNSCESKQLISGVPVYKLSSSGEGYSSQLTLLPRQQLAVIIMANDSEATPLIRDLSAQVSELLLEAQTGVKFLRNKSSRGILASNRSSSNLTGAYPTAKGVLLITEENGQLLGKISGSSYQLVQNNTGWWSFKKTPFSSRLTDLGEWGRSPVNVISRGGHQILVAYSHHQLVNVGERIVPMDLPYGWGRAVGSYQLLNPDNSPRLASSISLRYEAGVLLVKGRLYGDSDSDYALIPIDNVRAFLVGNTSHAGEVIKRQINGLSISGFYFKRKIIPIFSQDLYKDLRQ